MNIPGLDRSVIKENTAGGSYERGEVYVRNGAVNVVKHVEGEIEARVEGSQYLPYTVHIEYDDGGVGAVNCTCPYHEGTWCKHIAATLMTVLERGADPESADSVRALLLNLDREALVTLVERLVEHDPALADRIEDEYTHLK